MDQLSKDALKRIVFALIGLVVGLIDFLIKSTDVSESVFKAFAVAAVLFIGELVLEIRDAQKMEKETHSKFVHQNRNLTGALLAQLNTELERAIKIHEHQFIVEHETLAILSYDTFWKQLVEKIVTRRHLTVYTIHSCAIDVWIDHPLTTSLLNRQSEFCEKGGKIIRILCDRNPNLSVEVQAAADKMMEVGIEVKYYDLTSRKIFDHDFAWDFALINETGDAVIWDSFANRPGGVIGEAIYSNQSDYKGKDLKTLWEKVESFSKSVKKTEIDNVTAPIVNK